MPEPPVKKQPPPGTQKKLTGYDLDTFDDNLTSLKEELNQVLEELQSTISDLEEFDASSSVDSAEGILGRIRDMSDYVENAESFCDSVLDILTERDSD